MSVMNLQELCEETVAEVDGCLGCALVDLDTGLPLATKVVSGSLLRQDAMELLSAASVDYFRGHMVWQLELAMSGGQLDNRFVQDIEMTTEDTYNFMSIVPGRKSTLLVLVLDKSANLGLGLISMRQVLASLSADDDDAMSDIDTQPQNSSMIMPPAFAASTNQGATTVGVRSESTRASHVSYRDVSTGSDRDEDTPSEKASRQWRGGRGGRHHMH